TKTNAASTCVVPTVTARLAEVPLVGTSPGCGDGAGECTGAGDDGVVLGDGEGEGVGDDIAVFGDGEGEGTTWAGAGTGVRIAHVDGEVNKKELKLKKKYRNLCSEMADTVRNREKYIEELRRYLWLRANVEAAKIARVLKHAQ
nr:hypothetical protein [Tanacetum cinerariifolium]